MENLPQVEGRSKTEYKFTRLQEYKFVSSTPEQ